MKKDDTVYLRHIFDAIKKIEEYTTGMNEKSFFASDKTQDAVIRQLEIIGEATKRITINTRSNHSGIPWKDMAGMRDKLIHDYFGVDINAVWQTVEEDLPFLKNEVATILKTST